MNYQEKARKKAERQGIPFRKALTWIEPYDFQDRLEWLESLPEYGVVELEIGGLIAIEDAHG